MGIVAVPSISSDSVNATLCLSRDLYIDRLRSVMTALVVLHHTALTYGAIGSWFWRELNPSPALASQILILFCTTNQAYFLGVFFFLGAYFTPSSLERKGYGRFIGDRFTRLGLPLLVFILVLAPFTMALAHWGDGGSFWAEIAYIWRHVVLNPGPMWFVEALLLFSLAYCASRAVAGMPLSCSERKPHQIPSTFVLVLSAFATGIGALLIRQKFPVGEWIFPGFQLAYFATYVVLFASGLAAWRYDWLGQLAWPNVRTMIWISIAVWPLKPLGVAVANALYRGKWNDTTTFSWPAVLYARWEPLVAWGFIAGWLLFARRWMNAPSPLWNWVTRRAYTVFIIHPPALVGVSLLLHGLPAPALLKFVVTGTLTIICGWLLADPLVRLPGLRRIL